MKLISVYDDRSAPGRGFENGHGLCFFLRRKERKILFDAGENSSKVVENIKKALFGEKKIDAIVLSHFHPDHWGGVFRILNEFKVMKVFLPYYFPEEFKREIEETGTEAHETGKEEVQAFPGIRITKLHKRIFSPPEQSLLVETKGGFLLLTGCGHGGIVKLVKKVKKKEGRKVSMLAGGFHFYCLPGFMIKRRVKQIDREGVKKIAPCHCCGVKGIEIFKRLCPEKTMNMSAGNSWEFEIG